MAETTLIGLMGQRLFGKCPLHDWRDGYFSIQYLVEHDLFRGVLALVVNFLGSQAAALLELKLKYHQWSRGVNPIFVQAPSSGMQYTAKQTADNASRLSFVFGQTRKCKLKLLTSMVAN